MREGESLQHSSTNVLSTSSINDSLRITSHSAEFLSSPSTKFSIWQAFAIFQLLDASRISVGLQMEIQYKVCVVCADGEHEAIVILVQRPALLVSSYR